MNIGEAARRAMLNPKTVRLYEDIKLVVPSRAGNGYRIYNENEVHRLRFIQRSRSLGFTLDECRELLSLYDNPNRSSADVKKIAVDRINHVNAKISGLQSLKNTLLELADRCDGDDKPVCPILDDLSGVYNE